MQTLEDILQHFEENHNEARKYMYSAMNKYNLLAELLKSFDVTMRPSSYSEDMVSIEYNTEDAKTVLPILQILIMGLVQCVLKTSRIWQ